MPQKPGLRLSQTQRLTLTPGLRQSLSILGMSGVDLAEMLKTELAENPLLTARPRPGSVANDFDFALDTTAGQTTLGDHLARQIALESAPADIRALAIYLANDLDERGYLHDDDATIARERGLAPSTIKAAITLLQSCEPTGIAARSLSECLDLQLRELGEPPENRHLLTANLPLFAAQDWPRLTKKSGLARGELLRLSKLLHSLTPNPAAGIGRADIAYVRPDIRVTKKRDGRLVVEGIGSSQAALQIDTALLAQIASTRATALNAQKSRAAALIRALRHRNKTILRVANAIVEVQFRFFSTPGAALKPLTRSALAQRLDLHPSTITRAVAHKSLECEQGVFPLAIFFPSTVKFTDGRPETSSQEISQRIARMIAAESREKILSDAEISTVLRQSGVDIARRTVAKYRQCLKIPSSAQRRRSKRFL